MMYQLVQHGDLVVVVHMESGKAQIAQPEMTDEGLLLRHVGDHVFDSYLEAVIVLDMVQGEEVDTDVTHTEDRAPAAIGASDGATSG